MSNINFNRIVYSPEVQVYILPGGKDSEPIDISNDIIEGTITRRTEAVSTASFLVQSRKDKDNNTTLSQLLRPMDRIVIYLKKTKPILIFSGYLDLVPVFQAMPEPFIIEASCTLKRLEFTYWDPGLPKVYETLQKYGFVPQLGEGGISFFSPAALTNQTPSANGPQPTTGEFPQDTGFAAMLHFLLVDVGGWNKDNVWIEPIPEAWMKRAALLFQVNNDWEERYGLAQEWLKTFLTSGGSSGEDSGGSGSSETSGGSASSAKLNNRSKIVSIIDNKIKKYKQGDTDIKGEDFVKYGEYYNIDPRFLAAVACAETHYGTTGQGRDPNDPPDAKGKRGYNNMYGLGSEGRPFPSRSASIEASAKEIRQPQPNNYYLNGDPNQTIDGWIVNWTNNDRAHRDRVANFWKEMQSSGDPVNVSKPYSIIGQGIGTNGGSISPEDSGSNTENNPSSNTGGSNTSLSVYIEAGHSEPRQPGYQNQPGSDFVYARGDGKPVNEVDANTAVVKEIERVYKTLPQPVRDKINIEFAYSSRPKGWAGDVYISIHHDPSSYSDNKVGFAFPTKESRQGSQSADPGVAGPNKYSNGGTGFVLPESGEGGRNVVSEDSGLLYNSAQLGNIFASVNPSISGISATGPRDGSRKGMRNYYGFYYTNSSAAMIVELPADGDENPKKPQYNVTKIANAFIRTLIEYQAKIKGAGKQKAIKSGTEGSGSGSSGVRPGDDTPASKLIALCAKAAIAKENGANLTYEMGGVRGKNLSDCIKDEDEMDCSGFIYNGMKEIGISESGNTTTLYINSEKIADKSSFKAGHLFILGGATGHNDQGHVVLVMNEDGKCVHCSSSGDGPNFTNASNYVNDSAYELCEHEKIGTTTDPPTGFSSDGEGGSGSGSTANTFLQAKTVAFNVAFNFPGSLLESVLLTGDRALENDVKLFESVGEICKASMRTFASLPSGDFMAWYPDYFNLTGRNPWLRVSPTEIKSCTISLSDRQLVTHVYVLGNPFGFNEADAGRINVEWYEKLLGSGVVTIERPFILDSFLRPFEDDNITKTDLDTLEDASKLTADQIATAKKRPREILEGQGAAYKFLERYGARPYLEKIPTIRHPVFEFFYAYHTFIQKWAEQFITRVELTFMPELFPGMIVELELNSPVKDYPKNSVTFYVKEVTHSFSYQNGFYTEALLMAPGTTNKGNDWAMTLVYPPDVAENKPKRLRITTKPKAKPKTKTKPPSRTGGNRTGTRPGNNPGQGENSIDPITTQDGN